MSKIRRVAKKLADATEDVVLGKSPREQQKLQRELESELAKENQKREDER